MIALRTRLFTWCQSTVKTAAIPPCWSCSRSHHHVFKGSIRMSSNKLCETRYWCPFTISKPPYVSQPIIDSLRPSFLSPEFIFVSSRHSPMVPTVGSVSLTGTSEKVSPSGIEMGQCGLEEEQYCSGVLKKRRKKMNKHKYKKWRKKMRFKLQK